MAGTPATIGPYEILSELGRGGMGVVYRARQPGLDREVAIKVLLGGAHSDAAARERFLREAKATAQLRHPHIVAVYDTGFEGDLPWIAMDFIPGRSLDDAITEEQLSADRATEITRQIAESLHHAHDAGIVHRDVKPANVLLDDAGNAYLTDFGLARQVESASGLTASGAILGTPSYMAPEQARGEVADARADVYGCGALLYEMLTGGPPFDGDTALQTLTRVIHDDPTPPRRLAPRVSRELELVCLTAIAKERDRRYPSAAAMAEDCRRVLAGEPITARAPGLGYRLRRGLRRHRWLAGSLVLAAAAALGGIYFAAVRPAQQARAADLALLDDALQARAGRIAEFERLVQSGRLDEAITLGREIDGAVWTTPRIRDASLADLPRFAALRQPVRVSLATVLLRRGTQLLEAGDALGRNDLVAAFRRGRTGTRDRTAGRDALLVLTGALHESGQGAEANRLIRLALKTYGSDSAELRAWLARLRGRAGHVAEAVAWWHTLRDDPQFADEAESALQRLEPLAARSTQPELPTFVNVCDMNGDGRVELLATSREWRVQRREARPPWTPIGEPLQLPKPGRLLATHQEMLDVDGDGRPEAVISGGQWQQPGRIFVVGLRAGALTVLGSAPIEAECLDVTMFDADGDGTRELVASMFWHERGLRFFQLTESGLQERYRWPLWCDPYLVEGLTDGRLLIGIGPWIEELDRRPAWAPGRSGAFLHSDQPAQGVAQPWGYRMLVLQRDARGVFSEQSATAERIARGRLSWLSDSEFLLTATAAPVVRSAMQGLSVGVLRYRLTERGFEPLPSLATLAGEAETWDTAKRIVLGGAAHALFVDRGTLWLCPLDGRPPTRFDIPDARWWHVLETDDDPDPEVVFAPRDLGRTMVLGHGAFTPPDLRTGPAQDRLRTDAVPPEQELLEAGLYDEVIFACRELLAQGPNARTSYRLGVALLARKQWKEAAEAFKAAAGTTDLTVDALMRRAFALEELRDWAALAECWRAIADVPGVDGLAALLAARYSPAAEAAAAASTRLTWTAGNPLPHLLVENPYKARLAPDSLELWSTSEWTGNVAGPVVHYEGGPLRCRWTFRAGPPAWATDIRFGIQSLETLGNDGWHVGGPSIAFELTATGSSAKPTIRAALDAWSVDFQHSRLVLPPGAWIPEPEATYDLLLEYVPGVERVWCEVVDRRTDRVCVRMSVRPKAPLLHGDYLIGRTAAQRRSDSSGVNASCTHVLGLTLEGGDVLRAAAPTAPSALTQLGFANGALAAGDVDAAAERFARLPWHDDALRTGTTGVMAHLARALLRHRQGRDADARQDVARAVAIDAKAVTRSLSGRATAALSADERRWIAGLAGK